MILGRPLLKALAAHLADKINRREESLVDENQYGFGDSECGFLSTYQVDPAILEIEIDEFVKTFNPANSETAARG